MYVETPTSSGSLVLSASAKLMLADAVSVASVVEASPFAGTIPVGSFGIVGIKVKKVYRIELREGCGHGYDR